MSTAAEAPRTSSHLSKEPVREASGAVGSSHLRTQAAVSEPSAVCQSSSWAALVPAAHQSGACCDKGLNTHLSSDRRGLDLAAFLRISPVCLLILHIDQMKTAWTTARFSTCCEEGVVVKVQIKTFVS